jgi:DNA-binding transcriptional LysR family regulator
MASFGCRGAGGTMKNIPTDLLRTFVSVVDLRSFTRAAETQGVTQPAVSAQIRRLQTLVGAELLDKKLPGICMTSTGEIVLNSARRILAINDQILGISKRNPTAKTVRIGVPGDCTGSDLARMLEGAREKWPQLHFCITGGGFRRLLQGLQDDDLDIVLALVIDKPAIQARHYWTEQLAWVRAEKTVLDPNAPVPMMSYKEICVCHRIGVSALNKVGRSAELVFRATSAEWLRSAVVEGVGVMVVPRRRIPSELSAWDDGPLPPLPDVYCGIFLDKEREDETFVQVADHLSTVMRPAMLAPSVS